MLLYIFCRKFEHKKLAIGISTAFKDLIFTILIDCVLNRVVYTWLFLAEVCSRLVKLVHNFFPWTQAYLLCVELIEGNTHADEWIISLFMLTHLLDCHSHNRWKAFPARLITFLRDKMDVPIKVLFVFMS